MSDIPVEQAAWSRKPVGEEMKGNGFGDRARQLTEWFQAWNSCEQTIALYSLLSKVSAIQARFLSLVLEHSLKNGYDSKELTRLEKKANDAAFLSSLHSLTEDQALAQLLTHLPLLHPGNTDARKEYMKLLPKVLLSSSEVQNYLDQCRQLLSLALVHPAFPQEDREALTFWLNKLDKHTTTTTTKKIASLPTASSPSPAPYNPITSAFPRKKVHQIKSQETSSSLGNGDLPIEGYIGPVHNGFDSPDLLCEPTSTAPYLHPLDEVEKRVTLPSNSTAFDTFSVGKAFPKSTTLPACGTHSTSSSLPLLGDDISSIEWSEGMKDVPSWLKSLRLHKYAVLFAPMSYEDMLNMSADYLEKNNVTQGARRKIIQSICRLVKRPETLLEIEKDMEKHGRLLHCIQEIRQMLQTPIKPYTKPEAGEEKAGDTNGGRSQRRREGRRGGGRASLKESKEDTACSGDEDGNEDSSEEGSGSPGQHSSSDPGSDLDELLTKDFPTADLPSLLSRAMGKAYHQLMLHTDTNEDNLSAFIKLLDSALQHEAFTLEHKKLFFDWMRQCQQTLRVITPKKMRSARNWTIAAVPSQSTRGTRGPTRSLKQVRAGGGTKTMPMLTSARNSSTLPRVTPRNTGPALPAHTFRPLSSVYPTPSPTQMNAHCTPFVPSSQSSPSYTTHLPNSSLTSLPHRPCDQASFDHLAEGVAEYILNDTTDS